MEWQEEAIQEMCDIIYKLAFNCFESKAYFIERLRLSTKAIEMSEEARGSGRHQWIKKNYSNTAKSDPMTNFDELIEQIGRDNTPIEMLTTPARLFILVAQLQLALRHPDNTGSSAAIARAMTENMAKVLYLYHPEAQRLIEMGWQPAHDITREEFDHYEPSRLPFVNEDDPHKPGAGDQF